MIRPRYRNPRRQREPKRAVVSARVNFGMATSIDFADIPDGAGTDIFNCRIRYDKTVTRFGSLLFEDNQVTPLSDAVLGVYRFETNAGLAHLIRFAANTVAVYQSGAWTEITGTQTTPISYYQAVTAFDQLVFTNGVDEIQVVDPTLATFAQLGNAPAYKYITSFYNRVVGFNFLDNTTPNPIQLGWSGDGDITEWDPLVDRSAGSTPIIESPGDLADFGTGVFGFTNVMIILRQKSIWLATKQPSATNPFNLFAAVPGVGCDCPMSVAVVGGGIAYVDKRTRKINLFVPGMTAPESLGFNIERDLFSNIDDTALLRGSYDTGNNEYSISVPASGTNVVKVWTINLTTGGWSYDERVNLTSISDVNGIGYAILVDDLVGNVDDLEGNVNDLGVINNPETVRFYGFSDGTILQESNETQQDDGANFTSRFTSKAFELPSEHAAISKVNVEVKCGVGGTISMYYSKDSGNTWTFAKSFVVPVSSHGRLLTWQKHVRARKFMFKIESSNMQWEMLDYEVHIQNAGEQVRNSP